MGVLGWTSIEVWSTCEVLNMVSTMLVTICQALVKCLCYAYWPNINIIGPTDSLFIFVFFKQTLQFLQQINVKNAHPVYGAGWALSSVNSMQVSIMQSGPTVSKPFRRIAPLPKFRQTNFLSKFRSSRASYSS